MHTRQDKQMGKMKDCKFELRKYAKHIAYLFEGSKMIACSTNSWGMHAEMGLVPFVNRKKNQCLYVKRISRISPLSRPCLRCSKTLSKLCPNLRVFYTDENGHWKEDVNLDTQHRSRNDVGQATQSLRLKYKRKKQTKNI